ncbi:Aquaporin-1 [Exserohilum turcicum]
MPSSSATDQHEPENRDHQPQIPNWRRRIRGVKLPVLPVHNSQGNRDFSLTTSKGHVHLLDQFREKLPLPISTRLISMLSEFVGTFLFMLIGLGGNSTITNDTAVELQYEGGKTSADPDKVLVIAVSCGASITVNASTFFRISGGLFNPAVTMAMMIVRAVPPIDGFLDMFSQMAGAILASAIAYGLLPPGSLATVELGSSTTITQGLFIEMFITSQVVISVFMLATEKNKATFIAPIGIGLAVFACILVATTYTGAPLASASSSVPSRRTTGSTGWVPRSAPSSQRLFTSSSATSSTGL